MSSTPMSKEKAAPITQAGNVDFKLEVVVLPVADVDRSKRFYSGLGWRLDADLVIGADRRVVQFTPPGSECSIHFGKGLTKAAPGSAQGLILVVEDMESARAELMGHGVDVSQPFHGGPNGPVQGPDPEGRSYNTRAAFSDPDGNVWNLQEIKTRLPGRMWTDRGSATDIGTLIAFLREAETHHGDYQATAPKHHWSEWYASYIIAREQGRTSDEAIKDAGVYMEGISRK
jgi:catechol 2,3-dioxygenase-like lactoylglutathione lyase family enzyme